MGKGNVQKAEMARQKKMKASFRGSRLYCAGKRQMHRFYCILSFENHELCPNVHLHLTGSFH